MVHSSTPAPEVPSRLVMIVACASGQGQQRRARRGWEGGRLTTWTMARLEPVMSSTVVLVQVCGRATKRLGKRANEWTGPCDGPHLGSHGPALASGRASDPSPPRHHARLTLVVSTSYWISIVVPSLNVAPGPATNHRVSPPSCFISLCGQHRPPARAPGSPPRASANNSSPPPPPGSF